MVGEKKYTRLFSSQPLSRSSAIGIITVIASSKSICVSNHHLHTKNELLTSDYFFQKPTPQLEVATHVVDLPSNSTDQPSPDFVAEVTPLTGTQEWIGPFLLGDIVGSGSTSIVRLGTHKDTGFVAAVKVLSKDVSDYHSEEQMKINWIKVKREIVILKLIQHPNVLKLYDIYDTTHNLYLLLENVKGGELFNFVVKYGRLDRSTSLRMIAQVVSGLEHCHALNICHRDLKLENLLMDELYNIKIADFGMAQCLEKDSMSKTSCGSPHYAAPEVIQGGTYDAKISDVWSIGIILYALVTGSLPFDHSNISELLRMVTLGHFRIPQFVPGDIADLITQMLVLNPQERIKLSNVRLHSCFSNFNYFHPTPITTSSLHNIAITRDDLRILQDLKDLQSFGAPINNLLYDRLESRRDIRLSELHKLSPHPSDGNPYHLLYNNWMVKHQ